MIFCVAGWSLSSVVGFSRAASNALSGSLGMGGMKRSSSANSDLVMEMESNVAAMVYNFRNVGDLLNSPVGEVLCFAEAEDIVIVQSSVESQGTSFQLAQPVFVLASEAILLYSDRGSIPSLVALLGSSSVSLGDHSVQVISQHAAPFSALDSVSTATITIKLSRTAWLKVFPLLRTLITDK